MLKLLRKIRRQRFALAIDLRGDMRNNFLLWLTRAKCRVGYDIAGGGAFLTDIIPYDQPARHQAEGNDRVAVYFNAKVGYGERLIHLSQNEKNAALKLFEANGITGSRPIIALHPGASKNEKLWPLSNYRKLIVALLKKHDFDAVMFSRDKELDLSGLQNVHCLNVPSLRQFAALVSYCRLYVGLDTGPTHLAALLGVPVIALYGPKSPEFAGPYRTRNAVVTLFDKSFDCRPCEYGKCVKIGSGEKTCMESISVERVLNNVNKLMRRGNACA
jgi:ADP-heptose:LPS heptosyltransferase